MTMWIAALLFGFLSNNAGAQRGVVNGVKANTVSIAAGAPVSVTVSGINPCGGAFIDYGDGTAITYAITGLPTTQSHAYSKPGAYPIKARGMGNCDGDAATTITVTEPPAPPPTAAQRGVVNGVKANTASIAVGAPVSVTVSGINPCGGAFIDYGDGTALTYAITGLPTTQSHAYNKAGAYPIKARGMGNCDGDAATTITVTGPSPAPPPASPAAPNEITGVGFTPKPGVVRQLVAINVAGRGACAFTVKFGDGNQQEVNGPLPQRINHTYAVAKTYTVIVAPVAPCAGKFTDRLQVAARGGERITGLAIGPMPADTGRLITIDVEGVGTCGYRIDYGDGNHEDRTKPLPDRLHHVYNAAGSYIIAVEASGTCEGRTQRTLDVR